MVDVGLRTREAATVGVFQAPPPMMMVPSGTTSLTPGAWLSACASAAGIVAATALRIERLVMGVAPTCLSWATRGACIDAAATARACRWARFAGRLVSWLFNTTTTRSRLPDKRALTWLELNLEKLGLATLARGEPAAEPTPAIAVTPSAAAPNNAAALRGVDDVLLPPVRPAPGALTRPYSPPGSASQHNTRTPNHASPARSRLCARAPCRSPPQAPSAAALNSGESPSPGGRHAAPANI
jgi:hypothetical protein